MRYLPDTRPAYARGVDWNEYDAALFDLDGVITPTAEVHMRAWDQMFNDFLRGRGVSEPYTNADYFTYVDGKPRYDGVRSFLASRDITLPEGDASDAASAETVAGLGNRKNDDFEQILESEGVEPYPGSVALVKALVAQGTKMAIVSSSRNAAAVLTAAGMIDYFPVIVSGKEAGERGLPGKPAPDTFLDAAAQLGVPKERAVVFEDALSGVAAGRAGDFGLVIGVDRGVGADALTENGADVVVDDLAELIGDQA
jgi:beta-phosphoglucomutase family hydrolase